ncbi:hypothetical protein PPACK8108_LOCUS15477 [Phakopsora pachyrhizi]|uniref:Uncharacterized protein n=1 Tax=Phakopsora pachyrhizi TaxID=170000 RepID=A0AAV0B8V5_PHAPC|nr:hypothetical protein PPACK8108_LOCUS15477 [Phakopsora pachyrhizi]
MSYCTVLLTTLEEEPMPALVPRAMGNKQQAATWELGKGNLWAVGKQDVGFLQRRFQDFQLAKKRASLELLVPEVNIGV